MKDLTSSWVGPGLVTNAVFFSLHRVFLDNRKKTQGEKTLTSGLSFGHFSGNLRLVDLPEFGGFYHFPLSFEKILDFWTYIRKYCEFGKTLS